jgi:hypothetical protein
MINFLTETKYAIRKAKHKPEEIGYIGSDDEEFVIKWKDFKRLADFEYNDQSGDTVIPIDLIIEFKNLDQLIRINDGECEQWHLIKFVKFVKQKPIRRLHVLGCKTLKEVDEAIDREDLEL